MFLFHYQKQSASFAETDPYGYNPPLKQGYADTNAGDPSGYRNGQYGWGREAGFNDFVDQQLRSATATLVQSVEILALGRNSTPTDTSTGLTRDNLVSVTLAVDPRQAELIRVAEGHGELSLTFTLARRFSDGAAG